MDGGEPMSDNESCAPAHELANRLHNRVFGARIESAGRFIQEKDRSILEKSSGDADALPLADAQVAAALAHRTGEPMGHSHDKVVGLSALGSLDDLFIGRAGPAIGDVFLDGRGEEDRILQDHSDLQANRLFRQVAQLRPSMKTAPEVGS